MLCLPCPRWTCASVLLPVLTAMSLPVSSAMAETPPKPTVLFVSGESGYDTFRIPAVVRTPRGVLLAFCEGRRESSSDSGDIDLLLRRSFDEGRSWGPMRVIWDDGANTCGNPCPIVNTRDGTIVLLMTRNDGSATQERITAGEAPPRAAWMTTSADDGETWTPPRDISAQAVRPEWRWYATGPGHGIQLDDGRLVAPCDHSTGPTENDMHSHVIFSDDGGANWSIGESLPARTDESTVAQRLDGSLYLNMRNYRGTNRRAVGISRDRGLTWPEFREEPSLLEPVCQASVLRLMHGARKSEDFLVFSNPASAKRENLSVRLSRDGGETWPHQLVLWPGPAAYSDLVELGDGRMACLFEYGVQRPYETIGWVSFTLVDLERGFTASP